MQQVTHRYYTTDNVKIENLLLFSETPGLPEVQLTVLSLQLLYILLGFSFRLGQL